MLKRLYRGICQVDLLMKNVNGTSISFNQLGRTFFKLSVYSLGSGEINSVLVTTPRPSMDVGRITRQYPVETRVESYVQTDPEETDEEASTLHFIDSQWSDSHLDTGMPRCTYVD